MAPHTWFEAARANDYAAVSETMETYARAVSESGDTALIIAAENNALDVMQLLITKEACMVNKSGLTALMQASLLNCAEAAEILAPLEANICMPDGRDAFMLASSRGNIEVLKAIHPYFSLRSDKAGFSALDHAVIECREDAVRFILQNRVTTVRDLETSLFLAMEKEFPVIHELLKEKSNLLISTSARDSRRYDNLIRNPSIGNSFMLASTVSQTSKADERAVTFSRTTSPRSSVTAAKTPFEDEDHLTASIDITVQTLKNSNDLLRKENSRLQEQVKALQEQVDASADIINVVSNTSSPQGNPFSVDPETINRRAASLRMADVDNSDNPVVLRAHYEKELASANARADKLEKRLQEYIRTAKQDGGADYLKAAVYERDRELSQLVDEFTNKADDLLLSSKRDSTTLQRREEIGDDASSSVDVVLLKNPQFKILRVLLERAASKSGAEDSSTSLVRLFTPGETSFAAVGSAHSQILGFADQSAVTRAEMVDKSMVTSTGEQQEPPTAASAPAYMVTPTMTIAEVASKDRKPLESIPETPIIDNFKGIEYYKELLRQKDAEIARLSINSLAPITVPEGDDVEALKKIIAARLYDIRCLIVENNELEKELTAIKKKLGQHDTSKLAKELSDKDQQILTLQQELLNAIQSQSRPIMLQTCDNEEHTRKLSELSRENDALSRENIRLSNALVAAKAGSQRDRLKELTNSNRILLDELHSKDEELELLKMNMSLNESMSASKTIPSEIEALAAQINEKDTTIQSLLESLKAQEEAFMKMQIVLREKESEVENMRNATQSQEKAVTHVIVASQLQSDSARNSRALSPILYREDDETLNLRKSLRTTTAELSLIKAKLAGTSILEDGTIDITEFRSNSRRNSGSFGTDTIKRSRDTRTNMSAGNFVGIADESPFINVSK